jgi:uncharacterized protein YbaR (Trm112 family)
VHLLVTDRLACPRCGPGFGLILLSDRVRDRRVLEGAFGCANCRERYPVQEGFADLRPHPGGAAGGAVGGEDPGAPPLLPDDAEGALRLAAMLGVTEGPATLLLAGAPARHAERLAAMLDGVEVVALHPGLRDLPETPGVSRGMAGLPLPFFDATFRGVAADEGWAESGLEELRRVTAPGARMVLGLPDPEEAGGARRAAVERGSQAGREVLLETDRTLVLLR